VHFKFYALGHQQSLHNQTSKVFLRKQQDLGGFYKEEGLYIIVASIQFYIFISNIITMEVNESISVPLNDQQVMMLRLLKKPLPDEDFVQMRRLAVKLLAKQLDHTIEEWELQNDITEETYEKLAHGHFRTPSPNRSE
jgi:hypothetical protein